jgi:hypothetical protein
MADRMMILAGKNAEAGACASGLDRGALLLGLLLLISP